MKTMITTLIMTLAVSFGWSQELLPTTVSSAFVKIYPHIDEASWEANDKLQYEATFKLSETEIVATFGLDGTWLGERANITMEELPEHIKMVIAEKYGNYTLVSAEKVDTYMDLTFYKVGIHHLDQDWDVLFSDSGEMIMEEKISERYVPIPVEKSKLVKK